MCDPDSHPVGRYAKASLIALGIWESVDKKIARAENPLLAVKMVARGDVPLAIVFATDALADDGVQVVGTFPDGSHPPIRYPVAMLTASSNPEAARFLDYLKSPASRAVFERLGYLTLGATP
jgi:molybdate transport system substrate-binding protein